MNQYQVTSEVQRQSVSSILASKPSDESNEQGNIGKANGCEKTSSEVKKVNVNSDSKEQVANVIDAIFRNKKDDEKVIIKFEIEILKQ